MAGLTGEIIEDNNSNQYEIYKSDLNVEQQNAAIAYAYNQSKILDDTYTIGVAGDYGFGVGAIPLNSIPQGFSILAGYYDKTSDNYGNLLDATGSVMVSIPKFYFRILAPSVNTFEISQFPYDGYVLHRMFINAGEEVDFVLVDKYACGNVGGVFTSKFGIDPCSTHADHNPISNLNNTPSNTYGGLYSACKTRSDEHYLTTMYAYAGLAMLAKAHSDAGTIATCAFKDVEPYLPKGCNNNALADTNDSSVTYASAGYSNCGLTGAIASFAKTTHNGQNCGVADLNGNMYEVASGFIRYDSDGFLTFKESTDVTIITSDSTTQGAGGAYDKDLYEVVDVSDLISSTETGTWIKVGNGTEQVFEFSSDRTSNAYKKTSLMLPLGTGVSANGTTEFGTDGIYRYLRNEMACRVGLYWGDSSNAGVFSASLGHARYYSSGYVGGRASFNVKL
jgi:hypothetical protein